MPIPAPDASTAQAIQPVSLNAASVLANAGAASRNAGPGFDGVTTYKATSKQALTKAGYQFARKEGDHDVWVKVDKSSFIWVQGPQPAEPDPDGKSGPSPRPPPPPPPPPPAADPNVQEARDWANDLEKRFSGLREDAKKIRAMRLPNGNFPTEPMNEYFRKQERYNNDLKSVLNDEAPSWRDSVVNDADKKALEIEIERVKKVEKPEPEMDF